MTTKNNMGRGQPRKARGSKSDSITSNSKLRKKSTSTLQRPSRRSKENGLPFCHKRLRPAVYAKWTTVSKSTKDFIVSTLETNSNLVLGKLSKGNMESAQELLDDIKSRLMAAIQGLKVPKAAVTNYKQVQNTSSSLKKRLQESTEVLDRLTTAIDEEESLMESLENERDQLEELLNQLPPTTAQKQRVHPLLYGSHLDKMDLPELTSCDDRMKMPEVSHKQQQEQHAQYVDLVERVARINELVETSST